MAKNAIKLFKNLLQKMKLHIWISHKQKKDVKKKLIVKMIMEHSYATSILTDHPADLGELKSHTNPFFIVS